ncbi:2-dehydropantoate 2-reductase [Brevibacillus daliensis]|uniref:2-dehydropantoate 2-reductase n=1 Tax=Brevibacillus daliensis TaxID=2892995 RepID=UPI001E44F91A|nr:2-dehydropantoate 2-reductase [Brevibacillus daliensis]
MRILMVGAGAVGGYYGGRLLEAKKDITFLVRSGRKKQLEARGLRIESVHGDATLTPLLLVAGENSEAFDLIILSPKAYHLDQIMEDMAPYVGEETLIMPLLNGMAHMERLQQRFGADRVLGGLCFIESTLNQEGDVIQTSKVHRLAYGEWNGGTSERVQKIQEFFADANAQFDLSEQIQTEAWHKYLYITTLSGITTLMKSSVGPIKEAPNGMELVEQLFRECIAVMEAVDAPIASDILEKWMVTFEKQGYKTKSSMLRDMEKGLYVEADHLQGYLLKLAKEQEVETPLLRIVYNNLKIYEENLVSAKL